MLSSGNKLGRYQIHAAIGAGGMGEVYLAEDLKLGRKVALKILPENIVSNKEQIGRFEQEARAASGLNHPNILTVYEIGAEGDLNFIVTEYIEGESLRGLMNKGRIELRKALDIAIQIASALATSHASGIIHRDIKPENVMIRQDGIIKVLDFGLAKLISKSAREEIGTEASTKALVKTASGIILGTPAYMSPEQARGKEVDAQTDIFSFGVMLYEMISGKRPFEGESAMDVISSILKNEPIPLHQLNPDIPHNLERIINKTLRKDPEERYQTAKDLLIDLKDIKQDLEFQNKLERTEPPQREEAKTLAFNATTSDAATQTTSSAEYIVNSIKNHKRLAFLGFIPLILAAALFLFLNRAPALTEKDTILLTDFVNTTGDAVFDQTLKQALAVQLAQSPYLNIFSDERARETLKLMNRKPDERITKEIAREISERQGIKAILTGSISSIGNNFVINLEAINSTNGDGIAREQVEAASKEQVLEKLGEAATKLRGKLGESLQSIQKFDKPLEEATTSSLEALKAYTLGIDQIRIGKHADAIPFLKRAIELDPNFALAYTRMAAVYRSTPDPSNLGKEYATKAFELRDRVTERERFDTNFFYYFSATGELDKAIEVMESARTTYPRNDSYRNNLAFSYLLAGEYEKAIEEATEGIRIEPNKAVLYSNLSWAYRVLGRYEEAKATIAQAHTRNVDYYVMHSNLYQIAFIEGNQEEMQRQLEWAKGKPVEFRFFTLQGGTEAFAGQLNQSHKTIRRAIEAAQSLKLSNPAADLASNVAARDALVGRCQQAKAWTANALEIAKGRDLPDTIMLAPALCGDYGQARSLIEEQHKQNPLDTVLNSIFIPVASAAIETGNGNPEQAIQFLNAAQRYEAGQRAYMYPVYIRGQAYLRSGSATEATAEFQKIIDRRSVSPASILYPLAHLGIARAAALAGETEKSRKAYQDFFALWKDADTDIPILIEAKQEYEKLK
jgi:eukaryotic-like serine/threonine-protein kinase